MRLSIGILWLLLATFSASAAAPRVPGSRGFTAEQAAWMNEANSRIRQHCEAGRFAQAESIVREAIELRERVEPRAEWWRFHEVRLQAQRWKRLAKLPEHIQQQTARAIVLQHQADERARENRFGEALAVTRTSLTICQKYLGEEHPETATALVRIGTLLGIYGRHRQAIPEFEKARAIREKSLGADHFETVDCDSAIANALYGQGNYLAARKWHQRALKGFQAVGGEATPWVAACHEGIAGCHLALGALDEAAASYHLALNILEKTVGADYRTASCCHNAGMCQALRKQYTAAFQLFSTALEIRRRAFGEDFYLTADSYSGLACCLDGMGRHSEAYPLHRWALEVQLKVMGREHQETATRYAYLGSCLHGMGQLSEAEKLFRNALKIREKTLPEGHREMGQNLTQLAMLLDALGKYREAEPLHEKALALVKRSAGAKHPDTATTAYFLAISLASQGKDDKAEPLFREGLAVNRQLLGEAHPSTSYGYTAVGIGLWKRGRRAEAIRSWQQAVAGYEAGRCSRADPGFDRSLATGQIVSPHVPLAIGLASLNQPGNAFRHLEAGLARGLLDEFTVVAPQEEELRAALAARQAQQFQTVATLSALATRTEEQQLKLDRARLDIRESAVRLARLATEVFSREISTYGEIQRHLPADSALVAWVEQGYLGECWGCVLRKEGKPAWERIGGSGKDGSWTVEDWGRERDLFLLLRDPESSAARREKLLVEVTRRRFGPLEKHLKASKSLPTVARLFVVPTGIFAYVPAELLRPGATVSYIPSGSVLARTLQTHRPFTPSSLLAVGDPNFDRVPPPDPPAHGLFVQMVLPNSHAARAGLQPGDVLLSIAKTTLESIDDIQGAPSSLPANADVWRDGKTVRVRLQGSPLGAVFDKRSARAAMRAWRRDREAVAQRGTGHKRLPGTRLEVEVIASMFEAANALLGSDASEQKLDELLAKGELKKHRILHVATHGEADEFRPGRSSLILAQDRLPNPLDQVRNGRHPYEGRLTVSRIRTQWRGKLDADLVVLSACQTGLGKDAGGEGLLGFAQAFLSIGARSVVLSRWKVDDMATSLLMMRFYENLLGKRKGVKPMGRAASLDEAKKWLRSLPRKDAERLATLHSGGVLRGSEGLGKPAGKVKPVEYKGDTPFAHPYYWAAFTLIGDPD